MPPPSPLAAAARAGVLRLLVATRQHPVAHDDGTDGPRDLITPMTVAPHEVLNLDDPDRWLDAGDIASYVERLLIDPRDDRGRPNPYATAPRERRELARAIETEVRHSFLLAASVARRHALEPGPVDTKDPAWREAFPATIGQALEDEIKAGYGPVEGDRWMALLRPLAYAQGIGLNREFVDGRDLWAELASVLDERGRTFFADDVTAFLGERIATHLIVQMDTSGTVSYRFHHAALAAHFLVAAAHVDMHARVVSVLLSSVRGRAPDWSHAGAYLRRALPAHAREGRRLDELARDPAFIVYCDADQIYSSARHITDEICRAVRRMLRPLLHRLRQMRTLERAFLLSAAARVTGTTAPLADGLAALADPAARVAMARVRTPTDYFVLDEVPATTRPVLTTRDRYGEPVIFVGTTGSVGAWDPDSATLLERMSAGTQTVTELVSYLDRDEFPVLAAVGSGGRAVVWDVTTRALRAWSPDGNPFGHHVVVGRIDADRPFLLGWTIGSASVWEPDNGAFRVLPVSGTLVSSAAVVPRAAGDLVAVAVDGSVSVWDPSDRSQIAAFTPPDRLNVRLLGCGCAGKDGVLLVVTGIVDGTVSAWFPGEPGMRLLCHGAPPTCITGGCDPAGGLVVALGYMDGSVCLMWPNDEKPVRILRESGDNVAEVALETDALDQLMVVAVGDQVGRIQAWNATTGRQRLDAVGDGRPDALALGRFRGGGMFLVTSAIPSVRVWDLEQAEPMAEDALHQGTVSALTVFTAHGRRYLATTGTDSTLRVWDATTGESRIRLSVPPDVTTRLASWSTAKGGARVAASTRDGLFILDPLAHEAAAHLEIGFTGSLDVTVFPGGSPVMAVETGRSIHLIDGATCSMRGVLTPPDPDQSALVPDNPFRGDVTSVRWGRRMDGWPLLAAGTADGVVWVWQWGPDQRKTDPGEPIPLSGHRGEVLSLLTGAIPTSGTILAAGSRRGSARLWDPETGELLSECSSGHDTGFAQWARLVRQDALDALVSKTDSVRGARVDGWDRTGGLMWTHQYDPSSPTVNAVRIGLTSAGDEFVCVWRPDSIDLLWPRDGTPRLTRLPLPIKVSALAVAGSTIYVAGGGGVIAIEVSGQ